MERKGLTMVYAGYKKEFKEGTSLEEMIRHFQGQFIELQYEETFTTSTLEDGTIQLEFQDPEKVHFDYVVNYCGSRKGFRKHATKRDIIEHYKQIFVEFNEVVDVQLTLKDDEYEVNPIF